MSEKLSDVVEKAIRPALAALPARMRSREAVVMLLAIGLQESLFKYRRQMANGPARGFWQFEKMGGVAGVLQHRAFPVCTGMNRPLSTGGGGIACVPRMHGDEPPSRYPSPNSCLRSPYARG